jgi:hypothetical protein
MSAAVQLTARVRTRPKSRASAARRPALQIQRCRRLPERAMSTIVRRLEATVKCDCNGAGAARRVAALPHGESLWIEAAAQKSERPAFAGRSLTPPRSCGSLPRAVWRPSAEDRQSEFLRQPVLRHEGGAESTPQHVLGGLRDSLCPFLRLCGSLTLHHTGRASTPCSQKCTKTTIAPASFNLNRGHHVGCSGRLESSRSLLPTGVRLSSVQLVADPASQVLVRADRRPFYRPPWAIRIKRGGSKKTASPTSSHRRGGHRESVALPQLLRTSVAPVVFE